MGREYMILRLINGSQSLPMEWFSYLFMSKCVILFCNHSISVSTRARSTYVQAIHNQNDVMMNTCVTMIAQWGPVSAMKSSSTFLEHHCGFTLYCMFKAFSLCLPMTFHSLPGTDSEVGGMLQHTTILASYIVFYKIDIRVLMNP